MSGYGRGGRGLPPRRQQPFGPSGLPRQRGNFYQRAEKSGALAIYGLAVGSFVVSAVAKTIVKEQKLKQLRIESEKRIKEAQQRSEHVQKLTQLVLDGKYQEYRDMVAKGRAASSSG